MEFKQDFKKIFKGLDMRNLKINDDMSQESICYSAEIWKGDKILAYASNNGRGGFDMFQIGDTESFTQSDIDILRKNESHMIYWLCDEEIKLNNSNQR